MSETHDAPEGVSEDTAAALEAEFNPQPSTDAAPGDDAAAEAESEGEGEQPQPKRKSAQDRIDDLTRARREAEREAAHWRRIAQESGRVQPEPTAEPKADAGPDPSQYQYGEADPGFIRDYTAHVTRQTIREEMARRDAETQARTVAQTWEQRQAEFAKANPDFYERVNSDDLAITPVMADAIRTSDDGAKVAYHLAKNPDEARRIAALNPLAQVRELGRLEARLATPVTPPATPAKTVSDAPPPAPQARGLKGQFKPEPDTNDFAAFERAYGR